MNKKIFDSITKEDAEKLLNEIWAKVIPDESKKELHDDFVEMFDNYPLAKITICYFIWKLKNDSNIKTWQDLDTAYHAENFETAAFLADDLCGIYSEDIEEWNKLLTLKDEYSEEELVACILKNVHFEKEYYDEAPLSTGRLANAILSIMPGDKVIEINAGKCVYLLDSAEKYKKTEFIGASEDYSLLFSAFMKSEVYRYSNTRFVTSDYDLLDCNKAFISTCIEKRSIDYVRYSPRDAKWVLSQNWEEYPYESNSEWNLCAAGICMTNFQGRIVAVMNAGELTLKQGEANRRFLCENGYIEGVIALPDKMYNNTWVNTYLVIMSKGNSKIKFLDVRNKYITSRVGGKRVNVFDDKVIREITDDYNNDTMTTIVPLSEIAVTDYNLSPLRYISNSESVTNTVDFGSLIKEIKRGITLKAADMDLLISDQESGIKCLRTSQFASGFIDGFSYYHGENKKLFKNSSSCGDILISKVGTPFKVALSDGEYLIVGNVYIIKIDTSKVSPEYIKCFLSSVKGQEEIAKLAVGTNTPILNISDVEKIRIPIFDNRKQMDLEQRAYEIVDELSGYHHQIKELNEEISSIFE